MKKFVTTRYEIDLEKPGLPGGNLKLAFLTDLHNVEIGSKNSILLSAIRAEQPDLVLCGGDMIVGKPGHTVDTARDFMMRLAAEYPIYCGTGNHEYRARLYPDVYPGLYEAYVPPLAEAGVQFLAGESRSTEIRGIPLRIFGFDLPRTYYARTKHKELPLSVLTEQLGVPADDAVNLLLAHNPYYLKVYRDWGAELTLCGHYHGGVLRIGKHRGLISPDFIPFSGHCYGHFARNGCHAVIGAGLGEHTIPVRIHNPRELVILTLCVNLSSGRTKLP